jgi:hypothetical protein
MMRNYIHRLRQESDQKKRRHALAWSVGITGIIFVLWLITLQHSLATSYQETVKGEVTQTSNFSMTSSAVRMARGWDRLQASVINSWPVNK